MGETVYIPMPGRMIAATIAGTVFVDPENARLKI
jgi:sarcosine oxidase subunit alpha